MSRIKYFIKKVLFRKKKVYINSNVPRNNHYGANIIIQSGVQIASPVEIDDWSVISENCLLGEKTKIGKFCSIARNVIIGPSEHPIHAFSTHALFYNGHPFNEDVKYRRFKEIEHKHHSKGVEIKNDVWVGANAVILQGVLIGNGAIIGAGAVVTKNVPDYAIAVGVPAKVIKYRFSQEKIDELLKSQWWNDQKYKI